MWEAFCGNKHQYCKYKFQTSSVYNATEAPTAPILEKNKKQKTKTTYIGICEFRYLITIIMFYYISKYKKSTLLKQLFLLYELFY